MEYRAVQKTPATPSIHQMEGKRNVFLSPAPLVHVYTHWQSTLRAAPLLPPGLTLQTYVHSRAAKRTHRREHVIRPSKLSGLFLQGFAYSFVSDPLPSVSRTGSSDGQTEAQRASTRPFAQSSPKQTLLVKSSPLHFQEHRRALFHTIAMVSLPVHCRMQGGHPGRF
jgi:hypothetical protein